MFLDQELILIAAVNMRTRGFYTVVKLSEIMPKIWCFWDAKFLEKGPTNFWPNFINYSHHWTCGKVWWWLAQRPPRLGGEKRSKQLHQNIRPAGELSLSLSLPGGLTVGTETFEMRTHIMGATHAQDLLPETCTSFLHQKFDKSSLRHFQNTTNQSNRTTVSWPETCTKLHQIFDARNCCASFW